MLYGTSQPQATLKPICPAPVLSRFPQVGSHFRTVVSVHHQAECILALQVHCQQEWLERGSTLSALRTALLHAARKTHWIWNRRLLPLQTTSPLFTALSNRFIVHREAWKSGTTA